MKKNLRVLCLGLAAAAFTCSFAQEAQDKTSLLKNADMELGLKGWSFDGVDMMGKNTKNPSVQIGFHGMSKGVQEAWHSNPSNPLGDNYVMQRITNLPAGTYVFGAYAAAAKQHNRNDICERETVNGTEKHVLVDGKHQYSEYWSNRDSIHGVVLFANDDSVVVATDNPDLSALSQFFGHSSKFNVAAKLTEADAAKNFLNVGMRTVNTNANYIVWDNATLYYFGEMSEAEALDAMAEIDMTKAVAIADTLITNGFVMQADTLSALQNIIKELNAGTTTAATLWNDSKALHQAAGMARKSITDYENLKKNIERAKIVAEDPVWAYTILDYVPMLTAKLGEANKAYTEKKLNRAGLTDLRNELNWLVGAVKIDSLYTAQDDLQNFIKEVQDKQGQPGGYSAVQCNSLLELNEELGDTIAAFNEIWGATYDKDILNPNDLWPYVARVYNAIQDVKDNPISSEYTQMPIEFKPAEDKWIVGSYWQNEGLKIRAYQSPTYRFENKIENFRITVRHNKNNAKFFCLSDLAFFDGNGNRIELTEDNVTSNADHNALNGTPDGGGIEAMFDVTDDGHANTNTYFHSAWQNMPAGDHYLDVTLPNGGYEVFSFKITSRDNTNGYDQSHTFPGEMIISTPMPNREELEGTLARAKALNAYANNEPGFYSLENGGFEYLLDAIAAVEAALEGYPSEATCKEMNNDLKKQIGAFEGTENPINLPVADKKYRVVSGFPGFYEKQSVEKAWTVTKDTLWWGNVDAENSAAQEFHFIPVLDENGEQMVDTKIENDNEVISYFYTIKNAASGRYVDSTFVGDPQVLQMVKKEVADTVVLKSLGRGQWNIILQSGQVLHAGDHNSGNPTESKGAYGGTAGISSRLVPYGGGIDGASAWFIREYATLPKHYSVTGKEFKSECIHFEAANTITLTADKDCAFTDLALYDVYGNAIAIDSLVIEGKVATITAVNKDLVECAFSFTNNEGVHTVILDAFQYIADMTRLQQAYDAAVEFAPEEGAAVFQYADITAYTAALAEAEAMLEAGAETEAVDAMIEKLDAVIAALVPNMPEADKYYYILSGLDKFEAKQGYNMAIYTKESKVFWAQENECDWRRYWQFEQATEDELVAAGVKAEKAAEVKAYFIKNVATDKYIGKAEGNSSQIEMVETKSATVPYTISALQGSIVAIASVNNEGFRLHGAGHGEGAGRSGQIVYWGSGLGTASAWTIVEAQYDTTDLDFTEVEEESKAVVKGTYDLFGRRVAAPTAPGLYIIDGKKKLVK